jgi:ABC-type lipoprotein export system ATPase subunit
LSSAFAPESQQTPGLLSCSDISVRYDADGTTSWPLKDLSFAIGPGTTAVMGPSGSGKSTLLRVLAGLQRPTSGDVLLDGRPVRHHRRRPDADQRIGLVHQDYRLVTFLTVEENLRLAAELKDVAVGSSDVEDLLGVVGLSGFGGRSVPTLSGGEQQRVAIARTLVSDPLVLLADEPTGALDVGNSERVASLLRELGDDGLTVLVATHDPSVSSAMNRVVYLSDGRLSEPVRCIG